MFLVLFVVSILLNVSSGAQFPAEVKKIWNDVTGEYHQECLHISNTKPEYITLMVEHGYVVDDLSFGCYLRCLYEKTGALKSNGHFDLVTIVNKAAYMSEELAVRCVEEAANEDDYCRKSLIAGNCTVMAIVK
ncbi:hypothetical protein FQR65_LT00484 [Abscondita terminalis]|nr:hypothetical protein FQR65_LT00484 [Abscondita terminalis]